MRRLDFYFDFISHNAWLAWSQLPALAEKHDLDIQPVPVVFGALLSHTGQLGPAEIRPKSHWMLRDVVRKAALLNVPINPPASHPFNPLPALRLCCCDIEPACKLELIDLLFRAVWVDSQDVSDLSVLAELLNEWGYDHRSLLHDISQPEIKHRLISQTRAAVEDDIFGVPSMKVENRLFWGYDDFQYLEIYLSGNDPVEQLDLQAWYAVKPSVQRKR